MERQIQVTGSLQRFGDRHERPVSGSPVKLKKAAVPPSSRIGQPDVPCPLHRSYAAPWLARGARWVLRQYLGFLPDSDANPQFFVVKLGSGKIGARLHFV